jgi:hypothetical protein
LLPLLFALVWRRHREETPAVDDHEERIKRLEELVGQLQARDDVQSEEPSEPRPADLALSVRDGAPGPDKLYVCRAEIANYGQGEAHAVRWWLSTKEGDVVSTVAGGEELTLAPKQTVELEVVEIPGWEKYPLTNVWCRVEWRDSDGDHERSRRYVKSAKDMGWKSSWRRP